MEDWRLCPAEDLGMGPLARLRHERRESGLLETGTQLAARCFVKAYTALWHRVRVVGRENIPASTPMVLVANHASHLDSVVLGSIVPWGVRRRLFPIAAGDVFFETPLMTAVAAYFINALPMWRKNVGRHALDALRARLVKEGCGYILFPEGRRSPDGAMLPFKAGIGMMVAGTRVPVVPCYLHGCFESLSRDERLPRPRRITVTVGRPLVFEGVGNDREGWRRVAADLRAAVRGLGGLPAEGEDDPQRSEDIVRGGQDCA